MRKDKMKLTIENKVDPAVPFAVLERRFRENGATEKEINHARRQHAAGAHLVFYTMKLY